MRKASLLLIALAIIILVLGSARFYFSEADYTLENYGWNGLSQLSSAPDVKPLYSIADLSRPGSGNTLLIVSPATNFSPDESAQVLSFLQSGGKVIVLDDFGKADSLLYDINSPITINPVLLCQYEDHYTNQSFPIISNMTPSTYTEKVTKLVLNYPASLSVTGSAEVLASSSRTGWLDDGNITLDAYEQMGTYPVMARSTYAGGELLVVSDPDVLVNSMLDKGDNRVFLSNIIDGAVWVDASHGRDVTPLGRLFYMVKYSLPAQAALALLILLGCFGLIRLLRRGERF
jgi:hypothetical protein